VADFTHLHVHSEYSLLDGQSRLKKLIAAARAGGMNALALTDHGAMYGSLEFYKACKAEDVKPILGVEAWRLLSKRRPAAMNTIICCCWPRTRLVTTICSSLLLSLTPVAITTAPV
jgi:DNA polymerase III alpha subunit